LNFKILTGALLCLLLILGGCIQIKVTEDETTSSVETEVNATEEVVNITEEVEVNATEEVTNATEEIANATSLEEIEEAEAETTETVIEKVVIEGDLIKLKVPATDPDGDDLTYSFSEPLNESGAWQTQVGDAGEYDITVTVADSEGAAATQTLKILVNALNHAPVLEEIDDIVVFETETVTIEAEASDEDEDELTITYSGWMSSNTYTTNYDDAGNYTVTVNVTDGTDSVSQDVAITVNNKNRAPVIGSISLA